ncbi:MAG: helical backbone metal receptor [Ferruginibacter sp.]
MLLNSPNLSKRPTRIVSLVPSQTELLHYLGLEQETIAITKFCIHPADWYKKKLKIGGTKNLSIEKIIALQPDLIIANKEENVKEEIEALSEHHVWLTDISTLEDAYQMISDIGKLTHKYAEADILIKLIKENFKSFHSGKISVAYLIWKEPYMAAGGDTFINDMLIHAGFINVFASHKRYPVITFSDLKNCGCEIIMLSSEPYPFSVKHQITLQKLLPHTKIVLTDGEMFSWYGSRLLKATEYFSNLHKQIGVYNV